MPKILLQLNEPLAFGNLLLILRTLQKEGYVVHLEGCEPAVVKALTGVPSKRLWTPDAVLSLNADGCVLKTSRETQAIAPQSGEELFCGRQGVRPYPSPERCCEAVFRAFTPQRFAGKTILLTAGPTIEDADPARYVSNRSSGKMGVALARMAARKGATVLLIHGPMQAAVPPVENIRAIPVRSAQEMHDAVMRMVNKADIAILCAAVADFQPVEYSEEKIKKGRSPFFQLKMKRTPDILAAVGALPKKPFLVGFAAESRDLERNAEEKLASKHCDLLCANDILAPGCGFSVPTNAVTVFGKNGFRKHLPVASKERIADQILKMIVELDADFQI